MELSSEIKAKIESLLEGYKLSNLKDVVKELTTSYKEESKSSVINSELKAKIYAAVRMPATYKVMSKVYSELISIYNPKIINVLDIGAGLGSASLSLYDLESSIHFDMLEKEESMRNVGNNIYQDMSFNNNYDYIEFDLIKDKIDKKYDLVVSSYVLDEIKIENRKEALDKIFEASNDLIVIVEPGTPLGYQVIKEAREHYLAKGLHIVAPCPHEGKCPMKDNDWCHFATRLERNKIHKYLKEGESPFEDEKYSYIVFSKYKSNKPSNRIIRHPIINHSLIRLEVCNENGLEQVEMRKNNPLYKKVRKLNSGDSF